VTTMFITSSIVTTSSLPAQVCVGNAVLTLSVFLTVSHLLLSLSLSGLVYNVSFYKYIIF
jgi:hypothetical protein